MFQFQTGLRLGELCAVRFEDVENGVLHVVRMLQRDSDKVVEHTKSHEDREVLLTDAAQVPELPELPHLTLPHRNHS